MYIFLILCTHYSTAFHNLVFFFLLCFLLATQGWKVDALCKPFNISCRGWGSSASITVCLLATLRRLDASHWSVWVLPHSKEVTTTNVTCFLVCVLQGGGVVLVMERVCHGHSTRPMTPPLTRKRLCSSQCFSVMAKASVSINYSWHETFSIRFGTHSHPPLSSPLPQCKPCTSKFGHWTPCRLKLAGAAPSPADMCTGLQASMEMLISKLASEILLAKL